MEFYRDSQRASPQVVETGFAVDSKFTLAPGVVRIYKGSLRAPAAKR